MMRFLLVTVVVVFTCAISHAQQVVIETGKLASRFNYRNSNNLRMQNIKPSLQTFVSAQYRNAFQPTKPYHKPRFYGVCGFSYHAYSATASDPVYNNLFRWDTRFLGVDAGVDYEFWRWRNFFEHRRGITVYAKFLSSVEFLVNGTQVNNSQAYNLVGKEDFNKPFYFVRAGLGVNYCIARGVAASAHYLGGLSPGTIGKNPDGEKLRIVTHQIGVGLMMSFGKCEYCYAFQ